MHRPRGAATAGSHASSSLVHLDVGLADDALHAAQFVEHHLPVGGPRPAECRGVVAELHQRVANGGILERRMMSLASFSTRAASVPRATKKPKKNGLKMPRNSGIPTSACGAAASMTARYA